MAAAGGSSRLRRRQRFEAVSSRSNLSGSSFSSLFVVVWLILFTLGFCCGVVWCGVCAYGMCVCGVYLCGHAHALVSLWATSGGSHHLPPFWRQNLYAICHSVPQTTWPLNVQGFAQEFWRSEFRLSCLAMDNMFSNPVILHCCCFFVIVFVL